MWIAYWLTGAGLVLALRMILGAMLLILNPATWQAMFSTIVSLLKGTIKLAALMIIIPMCAYESWKSK